MQKYQKITPIMLFLNIIVYGYISIDLCTTSFVMKDGEIYAWLIYLIYSLPIIILFLFGKFKSTKPDFNILNKIILLIYTTIQLGLLFYYSSLIFTVWFYPQTEQYFFIFASLLLIIYLSLKKDYVLFSIGFAFVLISFIFSIINFSINSPHNLKLLLPLTKPTNIFKMFYVITFPLENLLYIFFNDKYSKPISKKMIVISTCLTLFFSAISIIDSYTIVTYKFYMDLPLPNINRYFLSNGDKIFQHLDIILFYYAFIVTTYKGTFYFKITYLLNNKIKKSILILIISILSVSVSILIIFISSLTKPLLIITSLLILYLAIIILFKKEKKYDN